MEENEDKVCCITCGYEFDSAYEFVEPAETAVTFSDVVGEDKAESTCPDCTYKLIAILQTEVEKFYSNKLEVL